MNVLFVNVLINNTLVIIPTIKTIHQYFKDQSFIFL